MHLPLPQSNHFEGQLEVSADKTDRSASNWIKTIKSEHVPRTCSVITIN